MEMVGRLEACWPRIWSAFEGANTEAYSALREQWAAMKRKSPDPLTMQVDLLSPLGLVFRETAHTQVWAFLLNPDEGHGLGTEPLNLLLDEVHAQMEEEEPRALALKHIGRDWTDSHVSAERAIRILTEDSSEVRRTDLWIEIPAERPQILLVIENKLDGLAQPGQLVAYERAIAARLHELEPGVAVVKLYLTRDGHEPTDEAGGSNWISMSYSDLALAWLPLLDADAEEGRRYAGLYLASLFQHTLDCRLEYETSNIGRILLTTYFRRRLGVQE